MANLATSNVALKPLLSRYLGQLIWPLRPPPMWL